MVLVTSEMSKEEREAAINQKIEEIRKKNENITLRYQEIENDKKNAETFSQEETERKKTRFTKNVDNQSHISSIEATYHESKETARTTTKGLRKLKMNILPASGISDFRPQRLTENDLPPPDPVFSYLTDRLREGALCAPISPATHRKRSTSSQTSEMSIGSSSSNNSRRVSTTSNSSWTSDTSSKCSGFSNYQPPRKYSACREYMKNRRLSSEHQLISSDKNEDDIRRNHQQDKLDQNVASKDIKKNSRYRVRGWGTESATRVSSDAVNSQNPTSIEITEGFSQYRQPWKRGEYENGFRSKCVTNWRDRHANFIGIKESGFTVDSIEDGVAQLAVFGDDLNNNDNTVGNQNMSMIETVYIN